MDGSQQHLRALLVMASALDVLVHSAEPMKSPHWGLAGQREEGSVVCLMLTSCAVCGAVGFQQAQVPGGMPSTRAEGSNEVLF